MSDEDVTVDAGESDDVSAPEAKNWWQFQSKDDAAEWANKIVQERLTRERKNFDKKVSEQFGDYDTLKAEVEELRPLKEATLTDAQRWESEKSTLSQELEDLRKFRAQTERENLVREIAEEKGLPARFVPRVRGDDADSITADIEELLNVLEDGKPKPAPQRQPKETDGDKPGEKGFSGGGGKNEGDEFDAEALAKRVRKNSGGSYAY